LTRAPPAPARAADLLFRGADGAPRLAPAGVREPAPYDPDLERAAVWRCWLGEDAAFQRELLDSGLIALAARGDEAISDEEWSAFLAGMQVGDRVVAPIARRPTAPPRRP
jgi:hypothetical protein